MQDGTRAEVSYKKNWGEAKNYCESISVYGKNFRLASINELKTIQQKDCGNRFACMDPRIFTVTYAGEKINASYSSEPSTVIQFYNEWKPIEYRVSELSRIGVLCVTDGNAYDQALLVYQSKANDIKLREKKQQEARDNETAKFRKNLQEGDETSNGIVIQIKGNLVKIQTNDSQCSQRDYKGNCNNWINTPVEKWIKRSEVYPK